MSRWVGWLRGRPAGCTWVGGWMVVLVVGWVAGPDGRVWPKTMRKGEPHLQYAFGTFPCILLRVGRFDIIFRVYYFLLVRATFLLLACLLVHIY